MKKLWTIALLAFSVILSSFYIIFYAPLPFVSSWWNAENYNWYDSKHKRNRIADGLILTKKLHNLHRSEVEILLGRAHETTYFNEWDMVYQLGNERGLFSIDSEWLVINLDDAACVKDYSIMRD